MASLDRYRAAQDDPLTGFQAALAELQAGRKTSHWIWYVFPQITGLGHSATARHYALADLAEACAYLRDETLRIRLVQATGVVVQQLAQGRPLAALIGGRIDCLKLVSSLTLFQLAIEAMAAEERNRDILRLRRDGTAILAEAARQGYPRCRFTANAICRS